jgi:DNA-directed RNA polymerase specialized sigma24 family protein
VDDPGHLVRLMRQVAAADRTAFAELHRVLSPALVAVARSRELNLADEAAVIAATFNEVWWMARFHTSSDADIRAWTAGIVMRRATDRSCVAPGRQVAAAGECSTGFSSGNWTAAHDQHLDNSLSALLRLRSGDTSGLPRPPQR